MSLVSLEVQTGNAVIHWKNTNNSVEVTAGDNQDIQIFELASTPVHRLVDLGCQPGAGGAKGMMVKARYLLSYGNGFTVIRRGSFGRRRLRCVPALVKESSSGLSGGRYWLRAIAD